MQIRSQYYFNGSPRFSFGWENPNHTAAVLVCLLPLLWAAGDITRFEGRKRWHRVVLCAEGLLSLLLILTYSRGGGMAWVGGLLFFSFLRGRVASNPPAAWFRPSSFLIQRLALFAVLTLGSGLLRRFASVATGDASGTNRLELWRGGLHLIHASPLVGWGKGSSGYAYMQWLQDPVSSASYGGMVNSYLYAAVEFGIPAFAFACFICLLPIATCIQGSTKLPAADQMWRYGCAAGLCAFSIASFFSTLWIMPSVMWTPMALSVFSIYTGCDTNGVSAVFRAMRPACGGAVILAMVLYGVAWAGSLYGSYSIRRLSSGAIYFSPKDGGSGGPELTFLADGRALGPYYGKEIREAVALLGTRVGGFTIYPVEVSPVEALSGCVIAMGPRIHDVHAVKGGAVLCAICPTGRRPLGAKIRQPDLIVLPEFDQIGFAGSWRTAETPTATRTLRLHGVGQDVRSQWRKLLKVCLEQTRS